MTRGDAGARAEAPMPGRAVWLLRYEEVRLARVEARVSALAGRVQIAKQDALDADQAYVRDGTPENALYLAAVVAQHRMMQVQFAAAHDAGSIVRLAFTETVEQPDSPI